MNSLEARQLQCVRGDRQLFRQLGFRLQGGELLHLRGANGAGKTSLLRILCGLARPESGELLWNGRPVSRQAQGYREALFYLGHLNALQEALTVQENLDFYATLAGLHADRATVARALAQLGLRGCQHRMVRQLSQGQKRRVALARLLLTRAPLWVLDEPFVALDQDSIGRLADTLGAHLHGGGLAVLTSHQPVDIPGAQTRTLDLGADASPSAASGAVADPAIREAGR